MLNAASVPDRDEGGSRSFKPIDLGTAVIVVFVFLGDNPIVFSKLAGVEFPDVSKKCCPN